MISSLVINGFEIVVETFEIPKAMRYGNMGPFSNNESILNIFSMKRLYLLRILKCQVTHDSVKNCGQIIQNIENQEVMLYGGHTETY